MNVKQLLVMSIFFSAAVNAGQVECDQEKVGQKLKCYCTATGKYVVEDQYEKSQAHKTPEQKNEARKYYCLATGKEIILVAQDKPRSQVPHQASTRRVVERLKRQ